MAHIDSRFLGNEPMHIALEVKTKATGDSKGPGKKPTRSFVIERRYYVQRGKWRILPPGVETGHREMGSVPVACPCGPEAVCLGSSS